MGIKVITSLLILSLPLTAFAREVSHIEIVETGHYDEISEDTDGYAKWCKLFNPTEKQLIHYFAKAQERNFSGEWLHEYYSPCIASGTVTFKDGSYGNWALHSSGLGGVEFKNKEDKDKKKSFLHLNNEWENE